MVDFEGICAQYFRLHLILQIRLNVNAPWTALSWKADFKPLYLKYQKKLINMDFFIFNYTS